MQGIVENIQYTGKGLEPGIQPEQYVVQPHVRYLQAILYTLSFHVREYRTI